MIRRAIRVMTKSGPNAPAAVASLELWLGADDADNYRGDCADAAFRDLASLMQFGQALSPYAACRLHAPQRHLHCRSNALDR